MSFDDPYNEREQSPNLRKIELQPLRTEPTTDSASQSSRNTSRSNLASEQTNSQVSDARRKKKKRSSNRNEADSVLFHYWAPNAPEVARQAARGCSCSEACSCEASSTEDFLVDMVDATGLVEPAANSAHPDASIEERPPQRVGFAKPSKQQPRGLPPSPTQNRQHDFDPSRSPSGALRDGSRPSGRPWFERKRSSQQDLPTLDTFQSPKRPRTTESNMRSTLQRHKPEDSPSVVITSPKLQRHMVTEPQGQDGVKLPPMAMPSPSSINPATIPPSRPILPSLSTATSPHGSSPSVRSRTQSTSSATTASSELTPFHYPTSRSRSSSFVALSAITPASSTYLSSPSYFPPGAVHGRRTLPPSHPPPRIHKQTSSVTSTASASSAPSLTHNESSISTPETVTPNSTAAPGTSIPGMTPIARKPRADDDAPTPSLTPYRQVVAGYECLYEGCKAAPFPTLYTLTYVSHPSLPVWITRTRAVSSQPHPSRCSRHLTLS